jgi:L,D-transpeptidase catalytic domain
MHRLLYLLLIPLAYFIFKSYYKNQKTNLPVASILNNKPPFETSVRLKDHSTHLLNYAKRNGFNTQYAFLVDMKLPSGSNRFFVYDLKKDSILTSALVTHGYGANNQNISFSNMPGSYCTSLGKYKIGKPYHGRFGLAYKLHGLDSSNSNAIKRYVVLHSHACVPSQEAAPQNICMSQGCPTVAPAFLTTLTNYLDKAEKPVLLYIFY